MRLLRNSMRFVKNLITLSEIELLEFINLIKSSDLIKNTEQSVFAVIKVGNSELSEKRVVIPKESPLFAMFIAIVVPTTMSNLKVLPIVIISAVLSCLFYFVPGLNQASSGITYVICAVVASLIGAIFLPIKEESDE